MRGIYKVPQCPGPATNVVVTHTIDPAFTLGPATASQGTVELNGSTITARMGQLEHDASAHLEVELTPLGPGTFTNTLSLTADQGLVGTLNIVLPVLADAPTLTFSLIHDALTFSWPASATGFAVEQTESLAPPIQWVPVSDIPILVGDQRVLSLQPTNSAVFYRLLSLP